MQLDLPDIVRMTLAMVLLAALDAVWFRMARSVYPKAMRTGVRLEWAVVAWALLGAAISSGRPETLREAAAYGAAVGALAYGVFNATELAVRSDYGTGAATLDTAWGVVACSAASCLVWSTYISDI